MLKIQSLSTGIHESNILHEYLSFRLEPSEILLLVGTNGIGKSILLKTILGNLNPIKGSVFMGDNNIHLLDHTSRAAIISLMLATPPQIEYMNGLEVAITGRQRFLSQWDKSQSQNKEIVIHYAKQFQMDHLLSKRFSQMSDGEKQKIMFIRCLIQETPLILLDEPLAFLDYPSKIHFLEQLNLHCKSTGTMAIISSHEIELSQKYSQKLLWLKQNTKSEWFENPIDFKPAVWINNE